MPNLSPNWQAEYLQRKKYYKHQHNFHYSQDGIQTLCRTGVTSCCKTQSRLQVTCLLCVRKLGPSVDRGSLLMMYGPQVRR